MSWGNRHWDGDLVSVEMGQRLLAPRSRLRLDCLRHLCNLERKDKCFCSDVVL